MTSKKEKHMRIAEQLIAYLKSYPNFYDYIQTFPVLFKWIIAGALVGIVVGMSGSLFAHTLAFVNTLREKNDWLILGLPLGGILIVFLYRFFQNTQDKGTNTIIGSVRKNTDIPLRTAPLIFISTVITHLFGGSAGREGAAIQLGGSIANKMGKVFQLTESNQRTIIMCGMSAGFSALFGTPLAASIFALEVIRVGIMQYSALVPCVTASLTAHFIAEIMNVPPETFLLTGIPAFTPLLLLKIIVFSAVVGGVSILFCMMLHAAEHLYAQYIPNPYVRIVTAGFLILTLSAIVGSDLYLGSGMGIIEGIFQGNAQVNWSSFLLKMLFTALALGAGFKGGEIVPSFCIGAAFGYCFAFLFGLPADIAAACGMVGLFCGVTNCPVSSIFISFELFGFEGMPYYLATIAVSYMLSGYHSLYHTQKIVGSKTNTDYETA